MAFLSWFVSYLLVFAIFVALAVMGCLIGIRARKAKDAREESTGSGEKTV